jgi:hypothetical protein
LYKHSVTTKAIPPLHVWLLALVILLILAVLAAILLVMLDDTFTFLAAPRGFSTSWCAVTAISFMPPRCAWASVQLIARE